MRNLSVAFIQVEELVDVNLEQCCIVNNELCIYDNGKVFCLKDSKSFTGHVGNALAIVDRCQEGNKAIYLGYSSISNKLAIAFASGDIVSFDINDSVCNHEGTIDPGLLSAGWSPGEDLISFVSSSFNLVVLDQDFDTLFETNLFGTGVEQPVSVGWGKSETQFRGTEGKIQKGDDLVAGNARDDGKTRISWRGDGEFLVVSLLIDNQRLLKVVSKDGHLVHSSEITPGLESALHWRPNGSIIASSQRLPNKHLICFFEKNTLQHGQFQLKGDYTVKELLWSNDSSVLAAILDGSGTEIQLFSTGNHHWYHKFTISVSKDEELVTIVWDCIEPLLLHVVIKAGNVIRHIRYSWRWIINCSSGGSSNDQALVSVIDGNRLLMTNFKRGICPPPMFSYMIECPKPINAVGFAQSGAMREALSSNDLFIQLNDKTLYLYRFDGKTSSHSISHELLLDRPDIFQLSWVDDGILLGCAALSFGKYELLTLKYSKDKVDLLTKSIEFRDPLISIQRTVDKRVLLCTNKPGFILYNIEKEAKEDLSPCNVPKCSNKILALEVRNVPILLDAFLNLHVGSQVVVKGATSMYVYNDVLLATTLKHLLLCIDLTSLAVEAERAIEPGARLVTVVPETSKVVLQLPRGNLEVVQPRALTIRTLKHHFAALCYGEAFAIMRRERINLNLLYDHDPERFSQHVDDFLSSVRDSNMLCTFVAELMPENVTCSMYKSFYNSGASRHTLPDKVDRVCSLILSAIEKKNDNSLLLVKLSCLIKQKNAGKALLLIKEAVDAEKNGNKPVVSSADGLRHVMYLIDIEQLFKIALGTYDLDLVFYVASKSQKDPKEYVPFLSNLREMEINYRRYTIDKFLKRYERALENLVKSEGKLNECVNLVVTQGLYKQALKLFPPISEGFKVICEKFSEELTRQKLHNEAGLILLRGQLYKLALHAFVRAGDWKQVIYCAEMLNYSKDQMNDLYNSLSDSLRNDRRHEELARLLLDHVHDIKGGVNALCLAHLFDEALRISRLHGQTQLVEDCIKPALLSVASNLLTNIQNSSETFKRQADRLNIIRTQKINEEEIDWDDISSESSKSSSKGSRTTTATRSAKNARKLERKLLSLKEGGTFEDLALVSSLHDFATQAGSMKSQVRALNLNLMLFNELETAGTLQRVLKDYINLITMLIPKIWNNNETGLNATSNSIASAFNNRLLTLPAPVQAIQPKLLFPPSLQPNVQWEFNIIRCE